MIHDPPNEENFVPTGTGRYQQEFTTVYEEGHLAGSKGVLVDKNPYRDGQRAHPNTVYEDELCYWWWKGYADYHTKEGEVDPNGTQPDQHQPG